MTKISTAPEALPDSLAAVARTPGVASKHDFTRLLVEIESETNFKPNSVNKTTGAAGPYQFIRSTWLALMKKYGESAGVKSSLVSQIHLDAKGRPRVANAQVLKDLLGLRHDAVIASKMASHYLDDGSAQLGKMLHRAPSEAETHFAYLLGPTGAANLIEAAQQTPALPVDQVIGEAATANKPLFETADGSLRTVAQAVTYLTSKYHSDRARAATLADATGSNATIGTHA